MRQDWATPERLFGELDAEFKFSLDVCAENEAVAKCRRWFTPEQDALNVRCVWRESCFMNPPYGRKIGQWVEKAWKASIDQAATVVCLLPASTGTIWFHAFCLKANAEVRFLPGRLHFDESEGDAPFASMIVIFRPVLKSLDPDV